MQGELLIAPIRSGERLRLESEQPLALVALLTGQPKALLLADLFACTPAEIRLAELIARKSARLGLVFRSIPCAVSQDRYRAAGGVVGGGVRKAQ